MPNYICQFYNYMWLGQSYGILKYPRLLNTSQPFSSSGKLQVMNFFVKYENVKL